MIGQDGKRRRMWPQGHAAKASPCLPAAYESPESKELLPAPVASHVDQKWAQERGKRLISALARENAGRGAVGAFHGDEITLSAIGRGTPATPTGRDSREATAWCQHVLVRYRHVLVQLVPKLRLGNEVQEVQYRQPEAIKVPLRMRPPEAKLAPLQSLALASPGGQFCTHSSLCPPPRPRIAERNSQPLFS